MTNILAEYKQSVADGNPDGALLGAVEAEFLQLAQRVDELEELLIMIVRTGWPWDEEGEPNVLFRESRDGFPQAMKAARELLGLGTRSAITRTEPRT